MIWFLARNDVFLVEQARQLRVRDAIAAIERALDTKNG